MNGLERTPADAKCPGLLTPVNDRDVHSDRVAYGGYRRGEAPVPNGCLLAVAATPLLAERNGLSLRVVHLLEELARSWHVVLVAPAADARSSDTLPIEHGFRIPYRATGALPLSQADSAALDAAVSQAIVRFDPTAAILWPGADDIVLRRRDLPPTVVDRIDCMALLSWRSARNASALLDRARALSDALSYCRYERSIVRAASATVVVGEDDARVLRRISGRDRVHVVPNGVALPSAPTASREARVPTVVFSGTLSYEPNIDAATSFAESVWPSIRRAVPAARLVIAGREPVPEVLRLAGLDGVEVLADIPDMHAVLQAAWVAVAPMRVGTGIKNKVLEAWAAAKPVVMTRLAANGLAISTELATLVADRPNEMAEAVIRLLLQDDARRELGRGAYSHVKRHHSWREAGERLSTLTATVARREG